MNIEQLDEKLKLYSEEIQQDCRMDQLNVKEKVGDLASIRHKWVARLIRARRDILVLERTKKNTIAEAIQISKTRNSPVELSPRAIAAKCATQPSIITIDEQIGNISILVDYLERVEKVFQAMGHDARNLVELIKIETL